MNKLIFYILFFGCCLFSIDTNASTELDSLETRGFNQAKFDELNESPRYDYDRVIEQKPNPFLNFFLEIFSFFARLFGSVIGWVVLALLVIGLVYVIATNVRLPKKKVKVTSEEVLQYDPEQNIQVIDYSGLLEEALNEKNYRLAIRYLYIITLQKLQTAELISWNKEKTNRDYYYELPTKYQSMFSDVLRIYEYVWYGEFQASESLYSRMRSQIELLDSKTSEKQ